MSVTGTVTQPWRPRPYDVGRAPSTLRAWSADSGSFTEIGGVGRAGPEEHEDLLADLGDDVALPRRVAERAREVEGERLQRIERVLAVRPSRPCSHASLGAGCEDAEEILSNRPLTWALPAWPHDRIVHGCAAPRRATTEGPVP